MALKVQKREENPKTQNSMSLKILTNKCTGCGLCVTNCPSSVLEMDQGKKAAIVRLEYCIKCGHCGSICPAEAIVESSTESKKFPAPDLDSLPSPKTLQQLFRSRRSVRQYKNKAISKKDLQTILEAGRYTATGSNSQTIKYIVITDPDKIIDLREKTLPAVVKCFHISTK